MFRLDIARKLRNGQLAFQLFAGDDGLILPSGELQDLWTADPWLLVALCQPGKVCRVSGGRVGSSEGVRKTCGAGMKVGGPLDGEPLAAGRAVPARQGGQGCGWRGGQVCKGRLVGLGAGMGVAGPLDSRMDSGVGRGVGYVLGRGVG